MVSDKYIGQIRELESAIGKHGAYVIMTHAKPDGDAMGSALGLSRFLASLHKTSRIVIPDRYPDSIAFMVREQEKNLIVTEKESPEEARETVMSAETVFCLDFNSFDRTENLAPALKETKADKILIDHHLHPDRDSFSLVFSETGISSTSELLYYILMGTSIVGGDAGRLPSGVGEALMTGMTTDTNNFANSVYPSTFAMASSLLAAGVDRNRIISELYNNYRENRLRLEGLLLDRKLTITEDGVAYMIIDKALSDKFGIMEGETEGFVNIPLGIRKVKMSILVKEDEDRYRISIRSKAGVSANRFAASYFNGGGHECASGGKLLFGKDIEHSTVAMEKYLETSAKAFMTTDK